MNLRTSLRRVERMLHKPPYSTDPAVLQIPIQKRLVTLIKQQGYRIRQIGVSTLTKSIIPQSTSWTKIKYPAHGLAKPFRHMFPMIAATNLTEKTRLCLLQEQFDRRVLLIAREENGTKWLDGDRIHPDTRWATTELPETCRSTVIEPVHFGLRNLLTHAHGHDRK